ncbi:MAG: molybdopterin-dependent oxidoreductase [Coriobacteriia bacterium]|nr:molybdopterin-dependent oxidoreductase [Coriobacteriia bacterium]
MQELTLTRRSFVKTATLAGAAVAMGTQVAGVLGKADKAWADEASETKMYVSTCHGCIQVCPCRVYVRDGIVVKIEGHPISPVSLGSLCLKGLSQLHTCYSPRRILYPIKRAGDRGAENMVWERISWDDAIELASTKIAESIEKYGTYSFFTAVGGGGSYSFGQASSMAFAFGSPTVFEPGCAQCYLPRVATAAYMYGGQDQSIADCALQECFKGLSPYEAAKGVSQDTKVLVIWGAQPSVSQTAQSGRGVAELRAAGCKTVVVDPNMSPDAVKADVWLRVRPGADGALILAWFRYIIEKKLYNEKFCQEWTNVPFVIDSATNLPFYAKEVFPDFEQTTPADTPAYVCYDRKTNSLKPLEYASKDVDPELFWSGTVNGKTCRTAGQVYKDTAEPWTLQKAEDMCWIPADVIEKGIRIYADAPMAGIANGVPTDMMQNASQVPLGLMGLDMIMGYINKPGAAMTQHTRPQWDAEALNYRPIATTPQPRPTRAGGAAGFTIGMTEEANAARVAALPEGMGPGTAGNYYVQGQMILDRLGMKNHKGLYHWSHSHIPTVLEAIKTGVPYKPRVWYDFSGNKMAVIGNAGSWYNAFNEIDFCICQYPNITSFQAEVADLIFPMMEWLEAPMASRSQLNYNFPETQVIHLGETVSNNVAPLKVQNATAKKLNAYIAAGNKVALGYDGTSVGAAPANPSQNSTSVGDEKQTSNNATYYHERDESQYKLQFPVGAGVSGCYEEDDLILAAVAARYGAPNYEAFLNDHKYQQPDLSNPVDPRFVVDPKVFWQYDQHLAMAADGLPRGFSTESRKCEVYCTLLIQMAATGHPYIYPRKQQPVDASIGTEVKEIFPGYEFVGSYSPICQHVEPAESPIEGMPGYDPEYPLTLTSGRVYYFHHGTMRHAPFVRELCPVPDVRMHPKTAEKYGLKHMDWVEVTSRRGSTKGRVYETSSMHEKVIWMERHWNPECFDNSQKNKTGGWRECNVNMLTKGSPPYNEFYGSMTNRGFTVNVKKTTKPPNVWVEPKEFEPFMPYNANQYVPSAGSALEMEQTPIVEFSDWDRG